MSASRGEALVDCKESFGLFRRRTALLCLRTKKPLRMTLVCLEQRVRRGTTSAPLVYSLSTESSRSVLAPLVRGQDSLADVMKVSQSKAIRTLRSDALRHTCMLALDEVGSNKSR